ncbi:hypothetical protein F5B22DRAFT_524877 [Xylaria bambusicola]|uniref:uncharacterized protein n=1 Tax=Xylaria bambusicola TaxID=326684 RepID=UPI0020086460|nr:uncharacterized protein F5B22DRAFT_524877 [Xylaria bambusicola]KAI0505442.1 hypothetical protein F5B22DRAFT_524877 [Xylaria bambusicola]
MSSFHLFPNLPTELRLEIWRAYFAICHGTQIHIFLSTPDGPRYVNQDAATGAEGHDTLAGARICADAWDVFQERFYVGDMRCLQPGGGRTATISTSTIPINSTATINAAEEEEKRRRYTTRFAVSSQDMMYIIDTKVSPILIALSSAPWFRRAPRIAIQVFNFHTPTPNPDFLPDPRPYPHNLDYWGRNWVLWNRLLSALPGNVRELMMNEELEQLLFVVVPNKEIHRTKYLRPNCYGFQVVDPESFALGSADETNAVNGHAGLMYARVHRAFERDVGVERKIGYVADAVLARAGFSCLDETLGSNY